MNIKEDRTAPVSLQDVLDTRSLEDKRFVVNKLLDLLNEKRDAYNGIASSIIYIISTDDIQLIECLKDNLMKLLVRKPMNYAGKMFISKVLFRLTQERPDFILGFFEQMIKTTHVWEKSLNDRESVLRLQIIALKTIRQAEHVVGIKKQSSLTSQEVQELCDRGMTSCDDAVKLDTLSLVLRTRSTTKLLSQYDLDIFRLAIQDGLGLQEPSLRQNFLSIANKFLERLKGSLRLVMRDQLKFTDVERASTKARYNIFLGWLIDFCFDSIYCNAYFGSFILTMSTLKLVIQHVTFNDENIPIRHLFSTKRCYDSLLSCLNDSFEENKALALDLLLLLPDNESFMSRSNMDKFDEIAYYLVNSVNPAHSLTCQYVFRLIIGLSCKSYKADKNQLLHHHLCKLLDLVEQGIDETARNLFIALKNNAIYPKLTCIRALVGDIEVNMLRESDRDQWAILAKRIIKASIEACHAVSYVVCNLNPETIGHLPMDQKPMSIEELSKSLNLSVNITDGQLETISSQMLLISGWKTIKECSLTMGQLCTCFWWPTERIKGKREKYPGLNMEPIIDSDDIRRIVDFFDHHLKNLRHRGAFEQAYNGFLMVTRRIWHDKQFCDLLTNNLTAIMEDFKSENQHQLDDKKVEFLKAYVTRRSAGLPFIVQAILNSEHKQESKTLRWVMDSLFTILRNPSSETYQRIHCLNILKALIKESCLGEKVIPFIGETFIITMVSFRSDSFPIRNCANMLLKATVDRTFGVNRLREDIHRRNKLSFEKFFNECPQLHSEMLLHLSDAITDRKCLASAHSVMIILSRLAPSFNSDGPANSDDIIRPFIGPLVELAQTCPDFKLRQVAAKLAVQLQVYSSQHGSANLTYFKSTIDDISRIIMLANRDRDCDLNRVHGAHLLLNQWILKMRPDSDLHSAHVDYLKQRVQHIIRDNIMMQTSESIPGEASRPSSAISLAFLDIVESYCLVWPMDEVESMVRPLFDCIDRLAPSACSTSFSWMNLNSSLDDPYLELVVFKCISLLLMSDDGASAHSQDIVNYKLLDELLDSIIRIIILPPNSRFSIDFQASILRLLRQLVTCCKQEENDNYLEYLMDHLDMDSTACFETPFDKLRQQPDNDFEQQRWARYCFKNIRVKSYMRRRLMEQSIVECLFNLARYCEFKPRRSGTTDEVAQVGFSAKFTNTPRAIELLALACSMDNNHLLCNSSAMFNSVDSVVDKMNYLNALLSALPDCDVKCLVLLYAADLFVHQLKETSGHHLPAETHQVLLRYTGILEELTDGHHSYIIRETCAESLRKCLITGMGLQLSDEQDLLASGLLITLLSTLIKLHQDEERSVRQSSLLTMDRLIGTETIQQRSPLLETSGKSISRMNQFIGLLTKRLLTTGQLTNIKYCLQLSMRIIFNHTKNFSTSYPDEPGLLFDKSKLNTFADHVATIHSALDTLKSYLIDPLSSCGAAKIPLDDLDISPDVLLGLDLRNDIDSPSRKCDFKSGDYNWRLKKSVTLDNQPHDNLQTKMDNRQIVEWVLKNIMDSLEYFVKCYWNMLTDTDYHYHELLMYKRIAFVKLMLDCTDHRLQVSHLLQQIRCELKKIVETSNSTTMLIKCRELASDQS